MGNAERREYRRTQAILLVLLVVVFALPWRLEIRPSVVQAAPAQWPEQVVPPLLLDARGNLSLEHVTALDESGVKVLESLGSGRMIVRTPGDPGIQIDEDQTIGIGGAPSENTAIPLKAYRLSGGAASQVFDFLASSSGATGIRIINSFQQVLLQHKGSSGGMDFRVCNNLFDCTNTAQPIDTIGYLKLLTIKSGTTQAGAGAAAGEVWRDTDCDGSGDGGCLKIGS